MFGLRRPRGWRAAGARCRGGGDTAVCRGPGAGSGTERGSAVSACGSWSVCAGDAKAAGPEERAGISSLVSGLPICFAGGLMQDLTLRCVPFRTLPGRDSTGAPFTRRENRKL